MISKKDFIKIHPVKSFAFGKRKSKILFNRVNNYLWEIPKSFRKDMRVPARIYSSEKMLEDIFRDESINQLINGATLPGIVKYGIAMPDCHEGYSVPIGFVGAIRTSNGVISPGACGFDINCGMRVLKSEHTENEIKPHLEKLAEEIQKQVPSGLGRGRKIKLSIQEIDKILEKGAPGLVEKGYGEREDAFYCESNGRLDWADASIVSNHAKERGRDQVGTLGSGNHFLEIQKVDEIFDKDAAEKFGLFENQILVMIHTGSRGLGHQVCTDYLKTMIPAMERYNIKVPDKEFVCVPFNSSEGQNYFKAMASAANYAWANRQMIAYYVRLTWRKILGEKEKLELLYDVAHNIIKKEKYKIDGVEIELAVHRKGATRAFPPEHPEIPEKYREVGQPVLIPGSMGTASYILVGQKTGEQAFYSTSHGAGRTMSRHQAIRTISGQEVINELKSKGIIVKCWSKRGIAEEAPLAYKDIHEVVDVVHRAGLSKKVAKLVPLAVIKGE
ncbi:RtcB family protein [Candidatus Parcubacteria bacterium]|nr:RtcB family protein [Candidatus Parcubacteria bacterium]